MSTLCAEPQFPAQATITQHWQKQEDALAASLVFEDSGFSCGVCVCVCVCEREREVACGIGHTMPKKAAGRAWTCSLYMRYIQNVFSIECVLYVRVDLQPQLKQPVGRGRQGKPAGICAG
jgi:hypothetical protein